MELVRWIYFLFRWLAAISHWRRPVGAWAFCWLHFPPHQGPGFIDNFRGHSTMSLNPEFACSSPEVKWLDHFGSVENRYFLNFGFRYPLLRRLNLYDRTQWCQRSQFWRSGSCALAIIVQYDEIHLFYALLSLLFWLVMISLRLCKLNTRHFELFCFTSEEQQARAYPRMCVRRILLKKNTW